MEVERLAVWVRLELGSPEKERDVVSEADSEVVSVEDFDMEAVAESSAVGLRVGVGGGVMVGVTVDVKEDERLAVAEPRLRENVEEKLGVMVLLVVRSSEKDLERDCSLVSLVVAELVRVSVVQNSHR
jgi:hypothetical protein